MAVTRQKRWREPDPADLPYHLQSGLTPEEIASLPKWKRGVRERYERNKAAALAKAEPTAPPLPKHVQEKLDAVREA
jgi:hypothetical protein